MSKPIADRNSFLFTSSTHKNLILQLKGIVGYPRGTGTNLSISNLSTLHFKFAKSIFLANFDVSTPVPFFKSPFVA